MTIVGCDKSVTVDSCDKSVTVDSCDKSVTVESYSYIVTKNYKSGHLIAQLVASSISKYFHFYINLYLELNKNTFIHSSRKLFCY